MFDSPFGGASVTAISVVSALAAVITAYYSLYVSQVIVKITRIVNVCSFMFHDFNLLSCLVCINVTIAHQVIGCDLQLLCSVFALLTLTFYNFRLCFSTLETESIREQHQVEKILRGSCKNVKN